MLLLALTFFYSQEREYELTGGIKNKKEKIQEQIEMLFRIYSLNNLNITVCPRWPNLYNNLQCKMGQDFLEIYIYAE